MSVRIVHLSDTHLGASPRDGVRSNAWAEDNRVRLIENDFYERFREVFAEIARIDPPPDLVIHSGDLYDSPYDKNPFPPPTVAETVAVQVIRSFTEETGIPVLIIDGNHGIYRSLDVSMLEVLQASIPQLRVATRLQLKDALRNDRPLKFEYEHLDVFCFPFMELSVLKSADMLNQLRDWITSCQAPRGNRISVAVAHGMKIDETLFDEIFSMGYDYIALGHDHIQHQHSDRAWYAGSTERWRFDEASHQKGFLIVDLEKGKTPVVTPHHLRFARPVLNARLRIEPDDTIESVRQRVIEWLDKSVPRSGKDPSVSARIRLVLSGTSPLVDPSELNSMLASLRVNLFGDSSEFNVCQFVWSVESVETEHVAHAYPEIISEYLIEDPASEFSQYLESLKLEPGFDSRLLTRIAVKALERAVQSHAQKLVLEDLLEDDGS
ncbi:MAG: metallophosphoesterase [Candidatus Thorarchaeota archaeon]